MSRTWKITAVVGALLVVLALTHNATNTTLEDLGKKPSADADAKKKAEAAKGHEKVPMPKPMGNVNAPVKIRVYLTSDNTCDTSTLSALQTVSKEFGDKVYVDFVDILKPEVKKEADKLKIGCKTGIAINGKTRFIIPDRGINGAILFSGPVGKKDYGPKEIMDVVRYLLKQKPTASSTGQKT